MESKKLEKPRENGTFSTVQGVMKPDEEDRGVFPTMKPLDWRTARKPAWNLGLWGIGFTAVRLDLEEKEYPKSWISPCESPALFTLGRDSVEYKESFRNPMT